AFGVGIGVAHTDVDLARVAVVAERAAGRAPAVAGGNGIGAYRAGHQLQHPAGLGKGRPVHLFDHVRPRRHPEAAVEAVRAHARTAVARHDAGGVRSMRIGGRATAGRARARQHAVDEVGVGVVDAAVDVGEDDAGAIESDAAEPGEIARHREVAAVDVARVDL